ncbi:hypothetical protein CRE_22019 [Caenorhabditis remanei]|uniref:F-box domain-containing protein n=1 Tax=Caenorhabditis remanei TaxID=31234 RepID=E3N3F1_CAERE|nr:hypothetical protein CRE_22019 [Caenorhabditis remanei]
MFSAFPLLRLPRLVLFDVFKSLNIAEKIKLSICSKKVSTQINNCRLYSQKVHVHLDMYSHKIEVFENGEDKFKIFNRSDSGTNTDPYKQQYQIGGCTVPVISYPEKISAFWKNHREGFLFVIRHLLKIFQCKFSTTINYYNNDLSQLIISKLFDLQLEFKMLNIYPDGSNHQNWLWKQKSSNFGLVEYLTIFSIVNPAFTPVFTSWPQNVTIMDSNWFTLKYLLACTSTTITLKGSRLGNKDVDEVLRKWKTGGFPNLQLLEIESRNITSFGATILGMNLRELNKLVIHSDDGSKKATIRHFYDRIEISVTPSE